MVIRTAFLDQRQNADDERAAAHQHNARDEDRGNAQPEPMIEAEDESIGASFQLLLRRERQHDLGARLPQQV